MKKSKAEKIYKKLAKINGLTETLTNKVWVDKYGAHYRLTKMGFERDTYDQDR